MSRKDLSDKQKEGVDPHNTFVNVASLWGEVHLPLTTYIASVVRDTHGADDVYQEVARAVVTQFDSYDHQRPFISWVLGIAKRQIAAYFRQNYGKQKIVLSDALIENLAEIVEELEPELERRHSALRNCIALLKGKARAIIERKYLHELKAKDIAKDMGLQESAIYVLLHRARQVLRKCILEQLASD